MTNRSSRTGLLKTHASERQARERRMPPFSQLPQSFYQANTTRPGRMSRRNPDHEGITTQAFATKSQHPWALSSTRQSRSELGYTLFSRTVPFWPMPIPLYMLSPREACPQPRLYPSLPSRSNQTPASQRFSPSLPCGAATSLGRPGIRRRTIWSRRNRR